LPGRRVTADGSNETVSPTFRETQRRKPDPRPDGENRRFLGRLPLRARDASNSPARSPKGTISLQSPETLALSNSSKREPISLRRRRVRRRPSTLNSASSETPRFHVGTRSSARRRIPVDDRPARTSHQLRCENNANGRTVVRMPTADAPDPNQ
jgi:hypothetical protein